MNEYQDISKDHDEYLEIYKEASLRQEKFRSFLTVEKTKDQYLNHLSMDALIFGPDISYWVFVVMREKYAVKADEQRPQSSSSANPGSDLTAQHD